MSSHPNSPARPSSDSTERTGPIAWFARHPKLTVAMIAFLLIAITIWLLDLVARGRVDHRIAAIRAKGEPVTVEDVEAMLPKIPESLNRSGSILIAVGLMRSIDNSGDVGRNMPIQGIVEKPPPGVRYSDAELHAALQYLSAIQIDLKTLHRMLEEDEGCFAPDVAALLSFDSVIPEFEHYRYAARAIAVECVVAAHESDSPTVIDCIRQIYSLSRDLKYTPSVIAYLARNSIITLATSQIESAVNWNALPADGLESLQRRLSEIENDSDIKYALLTERVRYFELLGLSPSTSTGGIQPTINPLHFVPILGAKDVGYGVQVLSDLVDGIGGPNTVTLRNIHRVDDQIALIPSYCITSSNVLWPVTRPAVLWLRYVAENRTMQASVAAERSRIVHGDWPATLDDLVPDYLAAVPIDPFTDKPLRYKRTDEGIIIYSFGEDAKDDDGDVTQYGRKWNSHPADTGFIFLNPDRRNQPAPIDPEANANDSLGE